VSENNNNNKKYVVSKMALHDRKWVVEMSAALWIYRHLSAYEREKKICAYQYKAEGIMAVENKFL
jgi:hypothetical protein